MNWIQVSAIIICNVILATLFMVWSGKEGKAFRKHIKEAK